MLFLSAEGWTTGILRLVLVIWGCSWGSFLIYQGRKTHVRLLTIWGIYMILGVITYLGNVIDFLTVVISGQNINPFVYILLSWLWVGINPIPYIFVVTELLAPNNKWYFISWTVIGLIFYELCLFLNPSGNLELVYPPTPGEEIITEGVIGPAGYYVLSSLNFAGVLVCFGLIYKGIQSQGIIRKKYIYFGVAHFLIFFAPIFDAIMDAPINTLPIIMALMLVGNIFSYLGLRKEPEKPKKKIKEEVKIKDSLFRITQRPDQITDEEVTYYREQKICLICKGKVAGFNIFLCPNCEALYHENCARKLSNLENACWVCNQPIDETKPTKPFKIIEEKKIGEISAKKGEDSIIDKNKNIFQ